MYEVHKIRLRLLSNFVILFLLIAFSWWTVLLFTKNRDAFYAKRDLMRIGMVAEGLIETGNDPAFEKMPAYEELLKQYRRQEWMIISEAFFFVISLVIGLILINRGYNREVEAALQSRNFLLSITHELKSPIASIRLVLETFMKRQLEPAMVTKLGQNALKETERLNDLVSDLLLSARLDNAYQPHLQQIDLSEFIADCVGTMQAKYPEVNFSFSKQTADTILQADEMGLSSVILNLLENGVKYSPQPAHIVVSLTKEAGYLVTCVADHGIGIDDREKKKIFSKFYRAGSEDTRRTKGTGLGLFIVSQIVKAHHGRIEVLDNLPQGSIFKISLPINPSL